MGLQRRAPFVNMPVCTVKGQGGPGADRSRKEKWQALFLCSLTDFVSRGSLPSEQPDGEPLKI